MSFDPQLFDEQLFGSQSFSGEGNLFDHNVFDSAIFDTGDEVVISLQEEVRGGNGGRKRIRKKRQTDLHYKPFEPQSIMAMGRPQALPVEVMSEAGITQEIAVLLSKRKRTDDEETALVLLMALMA